MLKVGITGGIGTGKTTICRIFEVFGIPVYYADLRAKRLMVEDQDLVNNIRQLLGKDSYFENGELNRAYIAKAIFNNQEKLNAINNLVHPAIAKDYIHWHNQQENVPYTLKEAAILFESGSHTQHDKIICITAPLDTRIERVIARDGVNKEEVLSRIDKQWPTAKKVALSDYIIENNGQRGIINQVVAIHRLLSKHSAEDL